MKISNHVSWVGKVDWELRKFHGEQLSTNNGSSYNAYLVEDEKVAIVDSVWTPFAKEFIENLKSKIELSKIDYIVVLHAEPDHSGALPLLVQNAPQAKIVCSASAVKSIKGYYHQDWDFQVVKTGEKLSLGKTELTFIEVPMLHWPDSTMAFLSEDNVLFSSDAFGQHYASQKIFDNENDQTEIFYEAMKYFANILTPFSKKVTKKIEELLALNLPISVIAPAHGIAWKDGIKAIIDKYILWANAYSENQITLIYDSMYNSTRRMAEIIAEGIQAECDDVKIKIFNSSKSDINDVVLEVFRSKAVLVGSPSYNNGILHSIAGLLDEIKGLAMENKKAAAFGSYGWSPANVKIISESLKAAGFDVFADTAKAQWNPSEADATKLFDFGKEFAKFLKQ